MQRTPSSERSPRAGRHAACTLTLGAPGGVGCVTPEPAPPGGLVSTPATTGRTRASHAVAASTSSARSAIAIWPNAVGWTWSAITRLRAPKPLRSSTSAPASAAATRTITAFSSRTLAPARGPPKVQRRRRGQHPIAALAPGSRAPREIVPSKRPGVPVERAHVVDADVQAAEVVAASAGAAARREKAGICSPTTSVDLGAVDGVGRERQPQAARRPQRPGLQRHAPLQLAAAVGDRVAEREHAETAVGG